MRFARVRVVLAAFVALFALALSVASLPSAPVVKAAENDIVLGFRGRVTSGPSEDTSLRGILTLTPGDAGALSGNLQVIGGPSIPVTGRLGAGNVSVTFDLGGGAIIFGIGIPDRETGFRGTFVGPTAGDRGSWSAVPAVSAAFDFSGTVNAGQGALSGVTLAGPLNITVNPLDGDRFLGSLVVDGVGTLPLTGELDSNGRRLEVTFDASVLGEGVTIEGRARRNSDGGYAGPFVIKGLGSDVTGTWTASPAE